VADDDARTRYVVGLGNPGRAYRQTRHNVGFRVLAALRRRWDFGRAKSRFHSRLWSGRIDGRGVTLLAPQTYMNESGRAVADAVAFCKAAPSALLVVLDDMALPTGRLRARARGSAGGHKGLDDILRALGTREVARLRIGIGRPADDRDATGHVLTTFAEEEEPVMAAAVERAAAAVEDWARRGITYVMDRYNASDEDPDKEREKA